MFYNMIGQQTFLLDKWPRPKKIDPNSPDSLLLVKSVGVWGRDYLTLTCWHIAHAHRLHMRTHSQHDFTRRRTLVEDLLYHVVVSVQFHKPIKDGQGETTSKHHAISHAFV